MIRASNRYAGSSALCPDRFPDDGTLEPGSSLGVLARASSSASANLVGAMGLVTLHAEDEQAREHITDHARDGEAITITTNDEATALNERIRAGRIERGEVNDTITAHGQRRIEHRSR